MLDPVMVFGFGTPKPVGYVLTWGSISSSTRHRYDGEVTLSGDTLLEVGVASVPGDSGSPIIDARRGAIVGVLTHGSGTNALDWETRRSLFQSGEASGTQLAACRSTIEAALAQ